MTLTEDALYLLQVCGTCLKSKEEICDHYSISEKRFTNDLLVLLNQGLVEKIPDPIELTDGIFILTDKGWEIVNKIWGRS